MKIVDYWIFNGYASEALSTHIREELKKGWHLYGDPFYCPNYEELCQAMVKYENS